MNKDILWFQVPAAIPQDNLLQSTDLYLSRIKKSSFIVFSSEHNTITQAASRITTNDIIPFRNDDYLSIKNLASKLNKKVEVINIKTSINSTPLDNVKNLILDQNIQQSSQHIVMSHEQCMRAINIGRQIAQREKLNISQLFIGGKIGIGNTIFTKAMTCALLQVTPEKLISTPFIENTKILQQILNFHKNHLSSPIEILCHLGDLETAALVGSFLSCAHTGLPLLINNLTSAVAALIAMQLCRGAEKWFIFPTHLKVPFTLFNALNNSQSVTLFPLQQNESI